MGVELVPDDHDGPPEPPNGCVDVLAENDLDYWIQELPFLHRSRMFFLGDGKATAFCSLTTQIRVGRIEYLKALHDAPDIDGADDEVIAEIAQDIAEWSPEQRRKLIALVEGAG